jgi:butyryl-CoA dehydrogenase
MDFALDEHQQDVQRRARAFAATEVAPVAAALDRTGSIPPAVINGVAEVGLLGCEHDFVAYVAGLIEISKVWASLGAVIAVHNSLVCYPISRYGDAAQK